MPQYLTPGPSELYFTVPDHIRQALKEGVGSISHRSKAFEGYYAHAVAGVRELLAVPEDYHIVFTSSATEIWERLIQNCVEKESFHLVNGSFSKRFYEFSVELGRKAVKQEASFGEGFDIAKIEVPDTAEMICCTLNETSAGVAMPIEDIYTLSAQHPKALITVDAVSALPYIPVDFTRIDSLFFSVQKGMGLPAGLGVWIFSERCAEKAREIAAKGISIGTYHSIPSLLEKAVKNQTPETPNILNIYLLGKICEDMLRRSVETIRQEMLYKSVTIYQAIQNHPYLTPLVEDERFRSHTVAVAKMQEGKTAKEAIDYLAQHNIIIGSGYGKYKNSQIRIANFPTHSKEIFERVYDLLEVWK